LFGCRLELSVVHDDREVEFHDVLEWLQAALLSSLVINASCEQHARRIALRASERWERAATVTVDEDGECGATVTASVDLG
jgi:hypothetical protein